MLNSTTELFYSSVQEVVEVVQEPKNCAVFIDHFLCKVYSCMKRTFTNIKNNIMCIKQLCSHKV